MLFTKLVVILDIYGRLLMGDYETIGYKILDLPTYTDQRGSLTVIQDQLPFIIKRIYWICGSEAPVRRGGHRHEKCYQALIAVSGKVDISIRYKDAINTVRLGSENRALILIPQAWHEMIFSSRAVLLVCASTYFDENDYFLEPV